LASTICATKPTAMSEFLSKIETFIFDILGLVLPGIILLAILISPSYMLDLSTMDHSDVESSYILSGLTIAGSILKTHFAVNTNTTIILLLILAYLLGHVVKVFAIIIYEFLTVIFDKTLNRIVVWLFEAIKNIFNFIFKKFFSREMYNTKVYQWLKTLFSPIRNTIEKMCTFQSSNYDSGNESLKSECIADINQRLATNYPDKWYSLYKISKIITAHEATKSLSDFFLAKYNLYRSLAFIFMFSALYYQYFFRAASPSISPELQKIASLAPSFSLILWFTFHYKYKRYWTLCGNETLVSLYYHLKKEKLNAP
jgi:hypothetical protein